MIQLFTELQEKKNVRSNLSALRASLKEATEEQKAQAIEFVRGHEDLVFGFLQEEDAKTRKNAALLLGDLAVQNALQPLWKAYTREQTLFVKSAYLEAMKALHAEEILSQLKDRLARRVGALGHETQAVAHAIDVGIARQRGTAKPHGLHHIGRLAAHARQLHQLGGLRGHQRYSFPPRLPLIPPRQLARFV